MKGRLIESPYFSAWLNTTPGGWWESPSDDMGISRVSRVNHNGNKTA
ncbi:MAG: hypothetical protein AAB488_00590 [Patescibacteria group bacterium]